MATADLALPSAALRPGEAQQVAAAAAAAAAHRRSQSRSPGGEAAEQAARTVRRAEEALVRQQALLAVLPADSTKRLHQADATTAAVAPVSAASRDAEQEQQQEQQQKQEQKQKKKQKKKRQSATEARIEIEREFMQWASRPPDRRLAVSAARMRSPSLAAVPAEFASYLGLGAAQQPGLDDDVPQGLEVAEASARVLNQPQGLPVEDEEKENEFGAGGDDDEAVMGSAQQQQRTEPRALERPASAAGHGGPSDPEPPAPELQAPPLPSRPETPSRALDATPDRPVPTPTDSQALVRVQIGEAPAPRDVLKLSLRIASPPSPRQAAPSIVINIDGKEGPKSGAAKASGAQGKRGATPAAGELEPVTRPPRFVVLEASSQDEQRRLDEALVRQIEACAVWQAAARRMCDDAQGGSDLPRQLDRRIIALIGQKGGGTHAHSRARSRTALA